MKNYKLIISYDGTDFHGFQIQKDKTTVQGELQKALEISILDSLIDLISEPLRTIPASIVSSKL